MIVREIKERTSDGPVTAPEPPKAPMKGGFPAPRRRPRPTINNEAAISSARDVDGAVTSSISGTQISERGKEDWAEPVPHINFQHPFPAESSRSALNRSRLSESHSHILSAGAKLSEVEEVFQQVNGENMVRIKGMTDTEREEEKRELLDRFGPGLMDLMAKRKKIREEARPAGSVREGTAGSGSKGTDGDVESIRRQVGGENERKVEGMSAEIWRGEMQELEERFGKSTLNALKRRAERRQAQAPMKQTGSKEDETEPGPAGSRSVKMLDEPIDPESLKRYFPNTPAEPAKLAWLQPSKTPSTDTSVRFDLYGNVLSAEEMRTRSTSEGLHHHGASPDLAGYTIDDILLLSRSTVPSQRILMLGLLSRILGAFAGDKLPIDARQAVEKADARRIGVQLGIDIVVASSRSRGLLEAGVSVMYQGIGGDSWAFLDHDEVDNNDFRPAADDGGIGSIPFDELTDKSADLLLTAELQPISALQVMRILRRGVLLSQEVAEIIGQVVPRLVKRLALKAPVPLSETDLPSMDSLYLLHEAIKASRKTATAVTESDLVPSLLRYLVVSTWSDDALLESRYATITLRLLTSLARYGLSAGIVTSALDVLRPLGDYVRQACVRSFGGAEKLIEAYWRCLSIWTVCAIDPHKTTPDHALTWAQVSALGWSEDALEVIASLSGSAQRPTVLAAVLGYLNAWVEGLAINVANARDQRREISLRLRETNLGNLVPSIVADGTSGQGELVEQIVRLDVLLHEDGEAAIVSPDINQSLFALVFSNLSPDNRHLGGRLLGIARQNETCSKADIVRYTLDLITLFQPGEESEALDLVDDFLKTDLSGFPAFAGDMSGIEHPDKLQILRPLLHHAVLPGADHVVGPRTLSHIYLKATTTLMRPAPSTEPEKRALGLPLRSDWLFAPLDELLDSASSEAIKQAPPDWDASELDIVRATLLTVRLRLSYASNVMSPSDVLFGLMKVFMLERDNQSAGNHPEVFRDECVARALDNLLGSYTHSSNQEKQLRGDRIESVAKPFLGPDMPFYQFYQDFLALFEAISFSDKHFTQLVTLPLSMSYPTDFRKLLWAEQPTALRSIRIAVADVPREEGDLAVFFRPTETDADVLAGYTRALINGWVTPRQEFLWRVATWHLACLFWGNAEGDRRQVRGASMKAICASHKADVVAEVTRLDIGNPSPGSGGKCSSGELQHRLELVEEMQGGEVQRRVESFV